MNRNIRPMSRTKCWLNGPVSVTPGTAKYHLSGDASMNKPLVSAAKPSAKAIPMQRVLIRSSINAPDQATDARLHGHQRLLPSCSVLTPQGSVIPVGGDPTERFAGARHSAERRERQVSG